MFKILFINPPLHNFIGGCHSETTPLGMMYLSAVLREAGYKAKVVDAERLQFTWGQLEEKIKQENPDIIGVGSSSLSLPALYKTVEIAHKALPNSKIIVGGPGPTFEPEKVLKQNPPIDVVVRFEAEGTILPLMDYFEGKKQLKDIKGIAYRKDGETFVGGKPDYINDINTFPWPAYDLLEPGFDGYGGMHLGGQLYGLSMPNAVIMASRGCPHRCIFCSNGQTRNRRRDPKDIVDEVEFCHKQLGAKSIQFYDDEFVGTNREQNKWIENICEEIIKRNLQHLGYLVQGRCSKFIELETLKKMKQAGFNWIWWGVESGSQKMLDRMKKDTTVDDIKRSIKLAKQAGVKSLMFVIVGLPGETKKDVMETAKLIEQTKPEQVRSHIITPFPGSELWNILKSKNQIENYDFLKYNTRFEAVHHTDELTAEEIGDLYRMLVLRYESNKKNLTKVFLKSFTSFNEFKKLPQRLKKIFVIIPKWIKIKFLAIFK